MSSETKPLDQNETANASKEDRGPYTPTTQSSPPSKEQENIPAAQTSEEDPKKQSLWKKARKLVRLFMWSKPQKGEPDESKPAAGVSSNDPLTEFINSYITHISEQKEYAEDHYKKLINDRLQELVMIYKTAKELKDPETKEKSLKDLKRDLMKLKLAIPSTNVEGAEKNDPLKNLRFTSSQLERSLYEVPEKLPHLHGSEVFNSSMELKHFVSRYKKLDLRVKLCLLCFSIFPQGAVIKKRLMVQWWVTEGYAESEKEADEFFGELTEKGFIEAFNVNRSLSVGSCKIHPFNRSALVALAEKANFFNFESGEKPTQNFEGCYQACLMGQGLISYEDFKARYEKEKEDFKKKNASSKKGGSSKGFKIKNADPDEEKGEDFKKKEGSSKGFKNKNESEKCVDPDEEKGEDFKKRNESLKKLGGSSKGSKNKNESEKGADPDEEEGEDSKVNDQSSKGADPDKAIEALINELEKLHLLMNVEELILEFKHKWFGKMRNINILYLGRWTASATHHIEVEDVEFLVKGLANLRSVKLLSLQGVSNIISLPDSILKLTDLTVLDLRACYNLEDIPEGIGRWLERLTHLDMSECYLLTHMPKSLSELKKLKVLKGFFVSAEDSRNKKKGCTLGDLEKLTLLEKLCIYSNSETFPKDEDVKDFGKLKNLSKLTITWGVNVSPSTKQSDEDEKQCDEDEAKKEKEGRLPKSLTKLDLKCFPMSVTPDWLKIKNLEHTELKKLYIRGGNFSDLGQYQRIDDSKDSNDSKVEKTWKVERLRLKYLAKIDMEWGRLEELFPDLKYLEQVSCPHLTLFPCDAKGVWIKSEGGGH